ncbi:MAG: hypothetical protein GC190_20010 [Alphaproteobacteria bacterium]|nr:hypothetical protein [Alphaproteobacteria bacterium]
MSALNWGFIQDGGVQESLMHAVLYAEDPQTILFGRPGKDAGQDARSADGSVVYQSKYRSGLDLDGAVDLALDELEKIKKYRATGHANYGHWKDAKRWVLFANFLINPNDVDEWNTKVVTAFYEEGLVADYWDKTKIEGKLAELPEVRDVFFGCENRVLVGLKEARDLLLKEGPESTFIDEPLVGREAELDRVRSFVASDDKRLLPVFGPGGIGKSRFLYESLVALSQEGWRVLWGLPGTMSQSSQWFRLLNGSQKTCVALDDPDDPGLLRTVIEQLSTIERRNWRVIFASPTERSDSFRRYRTNLNVADPIRLTALNESDSKNLVKSCLGTQVSDPWLHQVYALAQGHPGWLTLIASLVKENRLHGLPSTTDAIASVYVDSCLTRFSGDSHSHVRTLIRWLSIWGNLSTEASHEIQYLESEGITKSRLFELLRELVKTGLVRNWGVGKRVYSVDSVIVRQHLLSEWLLREDSSGVFVVNENGNDIVERLLAGHLPGLENVLQSLSHLAISRLDAHETHSFLRPLFASMIESAEQVNLVGQNHIVELVASLGKADPEHALDVLVAIRESLKESQEIQDPFWGRQTIRQDKVASSLSWTLFTLSDYVEDGNIAFGFISELRHLDHLEKAHSLSLDSGKSPLKLIERLLADPRKSSAFLKPAYDMVLTHLTSEDWWPFIGEIAKSLLDPVQQSTEWVANWTLRLSRRPIHPDSPNWKRLTSIREKIFLLLRSDQSVELRPKLWKVLSDAHHALHYALVEGSVKGEVAGRYQELLRMDLSECAEILGARRDFEEATYARAMWDWYLQYGKESELIELARKCETIYSGLSKWRVHDFFRFDMEEQLAPETERVSQKLREAESPAIYEEFFQESEKYLAWARNGNRDMADRWRIGDLASKLADLLPQNLKSDPSPLGVFVRLVLSDPQSARTLRYSFAIDLCRIRLRQSKTSGEGAASKWLDQLLYVCPDKVHLLWALYANAHPESIGQLFDHEIQSILKYLTLFEKYDQFSLLGVIIGSGRKDLLTSVQNDANGLQDDSVALSHYLARFIDSAYMAFLRYKGRPSVALVEWLFNAIGEFSLNGALLDKYEFRSMRDMAGFRPTMQQFTRLMQSRVRIERKRNSETRFEILPHDFKAGEWCEFNPTSEEDISAFQELCELALGSNFTALYWMPKFLVQIDPHGQNVAAFVVRYLSEHFGLEAKELTRLAYLASAFPSDSSAWADIARPICERTKGMRLEDREQVFFGLSKKETGVMWSAPGEVPSYYIDAYEVAETMLREELPDSTLRPYRLWAYNRAAEELRCERERAKELGDE